MVMCGSPEEGPKHAEKKPTLKPLFQQYQALSEEPMPTPGGRTRIVVRITVPETATPEQQIEAMMSAAVARHRQGWPDVVAISLFAGERMLNRLVYAPDEYGWSGNDRIDGMWSDLMEGTFPSHLQTWGVPTGEAEEAKLAATKGRRCRRDLQCWGDRQLVEAEIACRPLIERLALYDYEWTDGVFESKFDRWHWVDKKTGTLRYFGNKVKFQNGFGAWKHMDYICDYNPETEQGRVVTEEEALAGLVEILEQEQEPLQPTQERSQQQEAPRQARSQPAITPEEREREARAAARAARRLQRQE